MVEKIKISTKELFVTTSIMLGLAMYLLILITAISCFLNYINKGEFKVTIDMNHFGEGLFEMVLLLVVGIVIIIGAYFQYRNYILADEK